MSHEKIELKIEGMHCVACERAITEALYKVPGVISVRVSFASATALIESKQQGADYQMLIKAIHTAGYRADLIKGKDTEQLTQKEETLFKKEGQLLLLATLFTLPLIMQMAFGFFKIELIPKWLQFILATSVQFGFGWRFYVGSYYALKTMTGNMDLLICLGTSAAYFYSALIFVSSSFAPLYFESSSVIITLILLGRLLEMGTKKRASKAIRALFKLQPKTARVQKENTWTEIPIESMQVGDVYLVRPGEQIPIDGGVTEGFSYVDESMLTGESTPISKKVGSQIFAGSQNHQGFLVAQATAIGSQTALAHIIHCVQEAQSSKAPIQNLADKISAVFVPVVVAISLVTFFLWWNLDGFRQALMNSVAVLVIACPCALGMATPTVLMVAAGRGAREGILIKNAEALQLAQKIEIVAVDKTGTLTEGRLSLTDVIPDQTHFRGIAASLEELSAHPIATTLASSYSGAKETVLFFESITGKGVTGTIQDQVYYLGSLKWMQERGIVIDENLTDSLEKNGKTVVCLSTISQALCYFALTDALRKNAHAAIKKMDALDLEVIMLTGDRLQTAQAIAHQAGISTFFAEILPQDKAVVVEKLKKRGKCVGMVGDGINDAPALAAADVGFAMSKASDIALAAADITLMRNDLFSCVDAIDLSRRTFHKVRQNLFFAFCYNILGIPLAALGFLNPMIAGAAMALSSVCVISNALLLQRWKPIRYIAG